MAHVLDGAARRRLAISQHIGCTRPRADASLLGGKGRLLSLYCDEGWEGKKVREAVL
jgi:hypothetical protein